MFQNYKIRQHSNGFGKSVKDFYCNNVCSRHNKPRLVR